MMSTKFDNNLLIYRKNDDLEFKIIWNQLNWFRELVSRIPLPYPKVVLETVLRFINNLIFILYNNSVSRKFWGNILTPRWLLWIRSCYSLGHGVSVKYQIDLRGFKQIKNIFLIWPTKTHPYRYKNSNLEK